MAKIPEGILGILLGKVGPVSGHIRSGQNILRTAGRRRDTKITAQRTGQREKLKVCNVFTKAFAGTGFYNKTFPAYGNTGTGFNRATSAIMNLAITGNYPDTVISYPLVLISKGPLPAAENAAATATAEGNILFSWADNTATGTAKPNDKVILVAYFAEDKQVIYSLNAATRAQCQALLQTNIMQGRTAETWIGFLSNDEKDAANSIYTGKISL